MLGKRSGFILLIAIVDIQVWSLICCAQPSSTATMRSGESTSEFLQSVRPVEGPEPEKKRDTAPLPLRPLNTPPLRSMEPSLSEQPAWLTTIVSLVAVAGLLLLMTKVLQKRSASGKGRLPTAVLEVLGKASLDYKHTLFLVRWGSRLLLVTVGANGLQTLAELRDPDEINQMLRVVRRKEEENHVSGDDFLKISANHTSVQGANDS